LGGYGPPSLNKTNVRPPEALENEKSTHGRTCKELRRNYPKFQNRTAEHQPLHLDSKPHAWGAVDRHNIPKGLKAL